MRADQALMIGVGLFGAYAAYRLFTNRRTDPSPDSLPDVTPGPILVPDSYKSVQLGNPLAMKQNQFYRGRIQMIANAPPFDLLASRDAITQGLTALGFDRVSVFMAPSELPTSGNPWRHEYSTEQLSKGTRFFEGRWAAPSMQLARPPNLELIWYTRSPELAAAQQAARTSGSSLFDARPGGFRGSQRMAFEDAEEGVNAVPIWNHG